MSRLPKSRWNDSHPKAYIQISYGSQSSDVKFSLWKSSRDLPSTTTWCTAFMVSPVPGHWLGSGLLSSMVGDSRDRWVWVWVQVWAKLVRFHTSLAAAPLGAWETRHQPCRGRDAWCNIKWHLMSKHRGTFVLMLLRVQQTKRRTNNLIWSFPFPGTLLKWTGGDTTAPLTGASRNDYRGFWARQPRQSP